jgi:hypothetical protein
MAWLSPAPVEIEAASQGKQIAGKQSGGGFLWRSRSA